MKRWQFILRKVFLVVFSTAGMLGFVALLTSAMKQQKQILCKGIQIHVDYESGLAFVSKDEIVERVVFAVGDSVHRKKLAELQLHRIETLLQKHPYVDSAEVYFNQQQHLIVKVKQKRPILRIINTDGVGYYLSDKAETMPLSGSFTPRVPVAVGWVQTYTDSKRDSLMKTDLWKLISELEKDTFMSALTDHINVLENGEVELVPMMGSFNISFGKPHQNTKGKLERIKTFYKEALPRVGWDKYKSISVKFENQMVCVKRDSATNATVINENL